MRIMHYSSKQRVRLTTQFDPAMREGNAVITNNIRIMVAREAASPVDRRLNNEN